MDAKFSPEAFAEFARHKVGESHVSTTQPRTWPRLRNSTTLRKKGHRYDHAPSASLPCGEFGQHRWAAAVGPRQIQQQNFHASEQTSRSLQTPLKEKTMHATRKSVSSAQALSQRLLNLLIMLSARTLIWARERQIVAERVGGTVDAGGRSYSLGSTAGSFNGDYVRGTAGRDL